MGILFPPRNIGIKYPIELTESTPNEILPTTIDNQYPTQDKNPMNFPNPCSGKLKIPASRSG